MDGLERSGNVFLGYALSISISNEIISTRSHDIATLISHTSDDPFVVPVRDAIPSIASSKIYRDKVFSEGLYRSYDLINTELETIIERYDSYLSYLVDNPRFFIAPFHEFTKDHNIVVKKLAKAYPSLEIKKESTFKDIERIMVKRNTTIHTEELGNLPRPTPKKAEIEEMLISNYLKDINRIQDNIKHLYNRYYSL